MKILFTGASSFTGYWFIKELTEAGHEIKAIFTHDSLESYQGIRHDRVFEVLKYCEPIWNCRFGDEKFFKVITENNFDVFCHHAAFMNDYKSQDFNFIEALKANTININNILNSLKEKGCNSIILTGSVFEYDEGIGEKPLKAFSPYGLSKGLTHNVFQYFTDYHKIKYGKFVIPNPFGPYEDPRFTTFLINQWKEKKIPVIRTPKYVRDNIHVSLLAKTYLYFVEKVFNSNEAMLRINPSGYVETQGDFAKRFSFEIGKRLNINTELKMANQKEFMEPIIRINYDPVSTLFKEWDEKKAWDELAEYYKRVYL